MADSAYLVGFKAHGGWWHAFKYNDHPIRESTALNCNYHSLTSRSYEDLEKDVIGKQSGDYSKLQASFHPWARNQQGNDQVRLDAQ